MDTFRVTLPRGEWEGRPEKERELNGSGSGGHGSHGAEQREAEKSRECGWQEGLAGDGAGIPKASQLPVEGPCKVVPAHRGAGMFGPCKSHQCFPFSTSPHEPRHHASSLD